MDSTNTAVIEEVVDDGIDDESEYLSKKRSEAAAFAKKLAEQVVHILLGLMVAAVGAVCAVGVHLLIDAEMVVVDGEAADGEQRELLRRPILLAPFLRLAEQSREVAHDGREDGWDEPSQDVGLQCFHRRPPSRLPSSRFRPSARSFAER